MSPANSSRALNAYRNVGVESIVDSATPHQLIAMLFKGAREAIATASGHLQRQEIAAKGLAISKAILIIDGGLKSSLNMKAGGELAANLSDLYVYMGQRLVFANLKNDNAALDEVATLLEQLGDAWSAIEAKAMKPTAGVGPAPLNRAAAIVPPPANGSVVEGRTHAGGIAAPAPTPQSRRVAAAYGVL